MLSTPDFVDWFWCADLREGIAEKDDGEAAAGEEVKSKDNRALIDNNTAQTLSAEDINKMRTYEVFAFDSAEIVSKYHFGL